MAAGKKLAVNVLVEDPETGVYRHFAAGETVPAALAKGISNGAVFEGSGSDVDSGEAGPSGSRRS